MTLFEPTMLCEAILVDPKIETGVKKDVFVPNFKEVCDDTYGKNDECSGFMCTFCDAKFEYKPDLWIHVNVHTGETTFKCDICGQSFVRIGALTQHVVEVHPETTPYKCDICGKGFMWLPNWLTHVKEAHKPIDKLECTDVFKCKFCDVVFKHEPNLWRYVKIHTGETTLKCKVCGLSFEKIDGLTKHVVGVHPQTTPYRCDVCGKGYMAKQYLVTHVLQMHNVDEKTHELVGSKEVLKCALCDVVFKEKPNLWRHMTIHTGETTFKCELCGLPFERINGRFGSLTDHMIDAHPEEAPYKCDVCGARFMESSKLLMHVTAKRHKPGEMMVHKCELCGKAFSQEWEMRSHVKTVHQGTDTLKCNECGNEFANDIDLCQHMPVHRLTTTTSTTIFKCFICGKSFASRSNFRDHESMHKQKTIQQQ